MAATETPARRRLTMTLHRKVVPHEHWLEARAAFLAREKQFTRARDELNRQRQELPWELVDKRYVFAGPDGKETLAELFDGRSQLIVYHFMFAPDWDAGCPHCSFWADNFDPVIVHMNQRDVTMVAVSRAPYARLAAYRKRMGWTFKWLSSAGTTFNFDYGVSFTDAERKRGEAFYNFRKGDPGVSEREGISVFYKDDEGKVFRTYSAYARGIDLQNTAYNYIDLVPKGRDEGDRSQYWVRRRDEYPVREADKKSRKTAKKKRKTKPAPKRTTKRKTKRAKRKTKRT
jgi:predicted dithiol-disulfide oxidoreductase (DUF899 family)